MTVKFTDLQGKASKAGPERFKPVDGLNKIRIIGSVIPTYKYWLRTRDGSAVPMECLGFNRETEKFENKTRDVVREYFPEMRCSWAYQSYIIDRQDEDKIKLFDHKKRLFESILNTAKKKFGDPTDVENGWDIVFTRTKTGPKTFNVEYTLEVFDLENSALTKENLAAIAEVEPIEVITKLPTPEDQEAFLKGYVLPEEDVPEEVDTELEDDIPSS